jgi:hypothetical protein
MNWQVESMGLSFVSTRGFNSLGIVRGKSRFVKGFSDILQYFILFWILLLTCADG